MTPKKGKHLAPSTHCVQAVCWGPHAAPVMGAFTTWSGLDCLASAWTMLHMLGTTGEFLCGPTLPPLVLLAVVRCGERPRRGGTLDALRT